MEGPRTSLFSLAQPLCHNRYHDTQRNHHKDKNSDAPLIYSLGKKQFYAVETVKEFSAKAKDSPS